MIIFLDFDGVLHPAPNNGSSDFSLLPKFEDWLREHQNAMVVISSSWREIMGMDVLKAIFSTDLQDRIIDKCPVVEFIGQQAYWRYLEILQWIQNNNYSGKWLAIDDMASAFPKDFKKLVACKSNIGIDESVLAELTNKVTNYDHFS